MFSAIRRRVHVSPATMIATLALVFAMTGGAYAAKKYLITSTKQISPSVLKSLQGKAGPAGVAGAAGAVGAQGAQGPAGAAGGKGETGSQGSQGPQGPQGPEGKAAAGGGFPETLPSEKTETGVWAEPQGIEYPTHHPEFIYVPISFAIPLATELEASNVHFIEPNASPPAGCNGSVEKPEAEAGNLCVFASVNEGNGTAETGPGKFEPKFVNPAGTATAAGKTGTSMAFELNESGEEAASARGTWTVTAK